MLSLFKKKTSEFTFDDGVVFSLKEDYKPSHVQFFCKTDNEEAESCNLRLFQMMPLVGANAETESDETTAKRRFLPSRSLIDSTATVPMTCEDELLFKESARQKNRLMTPVFHRFGYYETFKINVKQFVDVKYEANRWYQLDILLDWDESKIAFFIDGKYQLVTPFYSLERDKALKVAQCKEEGNSVNTLSLYTLTPGVTSSFRDVRICKGLCNTS